ncbi:MAG: phosphatidate cytidylyltransferase [Deltaproteobacteria bacterium]|nr:phosphatidate cytidylyltransferase [Deltaproteobacteria bacterium]
MLKRLLTALIIVPPFLLLIRFGPPYALVILVSIAAIMGLYEFYQMTLPEQGARAKIGVIALGAILCALFQWAPSGVIFLFLFVILLIIFFAYALFAAELSLLPSRIAITFLGIIYVPFLLSHITLINKLPQGVFWVLLLMATVWIGDTFALAFGSWIGRHKLSPRISPHKTIEGFVACFVGAILTVFVCRSLFFPTLMIVDALMVATGIALFGQLGDLSESMIKRGAKVKDSGTLIPGHGGMLDRLDSFLFAAPFLYYFLVYKMFPGGS